MTNQPNFNPEPDPELAELLDSIRQVPARDPQAAGRSYARFLAEVDELYADAPAATNPAPQPSGWGAWAAAFSAFVRRQAAAPQRLVFSGLVAVLVVLVLVAGASATVAVAQESLPGDTLYPVKVNLEDVQARLSRDAAAEARLHLSFAERRLDEIARLIADQRYDDIAIATSEFESRIQAAIDSLLAVAAGNPAEAQELARQISDALARYAQVLSGMLVAVPETVRPEVQRVIDLSQAGASVQDGEVEFTGVVESISPQSWQISGRTVGVTAATEIKGAIATGDPVKVHASLVDGALQAREIELAGGQPGAAPLNANSNDNDDDDENINVNENDNEDDFDNLNDNGDDNLNDNDNGDDDDNLNDNDDDDDNLNDNDNQDDNDDNSGDNDDDNNDDNDDDNDDDDGGDDDGDDD